MVNVNTFAERRVGAHYDNLYIIMKGASEMKHIAKRGLATRVMSFALCGAMLLSSSGFTGITAYAAEPNSDSSTTIEATDDETIVENNHIVEDDNESNQGSDDVKVTVNLTDSVHGDITFATEDPSVDTSKVSSDSNAYVSVTPEDGYEVTGIVAVDESGNPLDGYLQNDIFTFHAEEEDVTVYAEFDYADEYQVITETDTSKEFQSVSDYILANADAKYVGNATELTPKDMMGVSYTYANGAVVGYDATIDGVIGKYQINEEPETDIFEEVITQNGAYLTLFETNSDSDYYVIYANNLVNNDAYIMSDYIVAVNDLSGTVIDDCIYDEKTGLLYVPKKYSAEYSGYLQIQMLQVTKEDISLLRNIDDMTFDVPVKVNVKNMDGEVLSAGSATVSGALEQRINIELTDDVRTLYNIDEDCLSIKFNSVEMTENVMDEMVSYDAETGIITIWHYPDFVGSIEITITKPTVAQQAQTILSNLFTLNVFAADSVHVATKDWTSSSIPTFDGIELKAGAKKGDKYSWDDKIKVTTDSTSSVHNVAAGNAGCFVGGKSENGGVAIDDALTRELCTGSAATDSRLYVLPKNTLNGNFNTKVTVPKCDSIYSLTGSPTLYMCCFHKGSASDWGFSDGNANNTADYEKNQSGTYIPRFTVRVLGIKDGKALLSFTASEWCNQYRAVMIKVDANTSTKGYAKKVMNTNSLYQNNKKWFLNNPAYGNPSDAKFKCTYVNTSGETKTKTMNADYDTTLNWYSSDYAACTDWSPEAQVGTKMTFQETTAPKNFIICDTAHEITLKADKSKNYITCQNTPKLGNLVVVKQSADTAVTDNNPCYDLSGAVYQLTASWDASVVFTATTAYDAASGKTVAKFNNIPLGTYTLKETRASKGYACAANQTVVLDSILPKEVFSNEPPVYDPITVALHKQNAQQQNVPEGDNSLENAIFHFQFYPQHGVTKDQVKNGTVQPLFEFDAKTVYMLDGTTREQAAMVNLIRNPNTGQLSPCFLPETWKYYGSPQHPLTDYFSETGFFMFPQGTMVLWEETAPEGYLHPDEDAGFRYEATIVNSTNTSQPVTNPETGTIITNELTPLGTKKVESNENIFIINIPGVEGATHQDVTLDMWNTAGPMILQRQVKTMALGYTVTKMDSKSLLTEGEGLADIGPVTYQLINRSEHTVYTYNSRQDKTVKASFTPDAVMETVTLQTDANGNIVPYTSDRYLLQPGTYEIVETVNGGQYSNGVAYEKPQSVKFKVEGITVNGDPNGTMAVSYLGLDGQWHKMPQTYTDGDIVDFAELAETAKNNKFAANSGYDANLLNDVWRGGVRVDKYDIESLTKVPQGTASFQGAEISIYNISGESVWTLGTPGNGYKDTVEIKDGELFTVITTDAAGVASTDSNTLPIGKYRMVETKAPKGYKLNENWVREFEIKNDGEMVVFGDVQPDVTINVDAEPYVESSYGLPETVIRGGVEMWKSDFDRVYTNNITSEETNIGQGDRDLSGYHFYVVNKSNAPVKINDAWYQHGEICYTLKTDELGHATSDLDGDGVDYTFPYGTYDIYEAPQAEQSEEGYYVDSDWLATFTIEEDGKIVPANSVETRPSNPVEQEVWRGGFSVIKYDWDRNTNEEQGDASLENCEFSIINRSKYSVYVAGEWFEPGAVCYTIATDANGVAKTPEKLLPYGTYEVIETKSSKGYLVNDEWKETIVIRKDGQYDNYEARVNPLLEPVVRGDVQITKFDVELDNSESLGGSSHGDSAIPFAPSLAGINFEIYNASIKDVYVDQNGYSEQLMSSPNGEWYDPVTNTTYTADDLVTTITTHWNEETGTYTAETTNRTLPYGTYLIREIPVREDRFGNKFANEYYLMTDGDFRKFEIREDGKVVTVDVEDEDLIWKNQVVRADIEFEKRETVTNSRIPSAWVIQNKASGERHVVVTDATAHYTSSCDDANSYGFDHTDRTNGNDWALEKFDAGESIKYEDLDYTMGTWFGLGEDGTESTPSNDLGAFPMGTYQMWEIKSDTNADYWDEPIFTEGIEFTIDNRHGMTVDLGTVENGSFSTPKLMTTALHDLTREHIGPATEVCAIVDTVTYEDLKSGNTYYIEGTLMTKDGSVVYNKDEEGNPVPITATSERFTVESKDEANGSLELTFNFDAREYEGKDVVVFETLYKVETKPAEEEGGEPTESITVAASHRNLKDAGQTVKFPKIGTTAVISGTETEHESLAVNPVKIVDTVAYEGLLVGKTYTIKGVFFDVDDNDEICDADGNVIEVTKEFIAKETNGTVDIEFEFDASGLEGHTIVCFEEIYYRGNKIAFHADLEDTNQTISFPELATSANFENETKFGTKEPVTVIKDTVDYSDLIIGRRYKIEGTLMDKFTGEPVMVDGEKVTAFTEFIATESAGQAEITFEFDATGYEGAAIVVFETLYNAEGTIVGVHEDIEDEAQTVYFTSITTDASYFDTGSHEGAPLEETHIIDTITYKGFTAGKEYRIEGKLMDKLANAPVKDAEGNEIVVTKTFTPEASDGTVDVEFVFDATGLSGKTVVVFQKVYDGDMVIAKHEDIDSYEQSVKFPEVDSNLVSSNGTHYASADGKQNFTDTVYYKHLTPGESYIAAGYLVDKETGEKVTDEVKLEFTAPMESEKSDDSDVTTEDTETEDVTTEETSTEETTEETTTTEEVTTEVTTEATTTDADAVATIDDAEDTTEDTTEEETGDTNADEDNDEPENTEPTVTVVQGVDGSVQLTHEFDTTDKSGKKYVAYAFIYDKSGNVLVGQHNDIEDEDQTVSIVGIQTMASYDAATVENQILIHDVVSYEGLVKGESYKLEGTFMNKATGKPYMIGDKPVTSTVTFEAEDSTGTVEVVFNITAIIDEFEIGVVYEQLYYGDTMIASHEDINDANQTVSVPELKTVATVGDSNLHMGPASDKFVINDKVEYSGVIPGKEYVVKGTLFDKTNGKLTDITAETTFTPEKSEGTVNVKFEFDATKYEGYTFVVYEQLVTRSESGDTNVAKHEDSNDEDQTVYIPKVETTLLDKATSSHAGLAQEKVELVDTVTYTNLIPGKEYVVTGTLMDKETGKELKGEDDKPITKTVKFTPEKADGAIEVVFEVKGSLLAGKNIVAFEKVEHDNKEVASHCDINDENQTVAFAAIGTKAINKTTGTQQLHLEKGDSKEIVIVDTVSYKNLVPGQKYTLTGTLMDKATGKEFEYEIETDGKTTKSKATATVAFEPEKADGEVKVEFTVPASSVIGKDIVVFEKLTLGEKIVATHEDINDEAQTVWSGDLDTLATGNDGRSKTVDMGKDVKIKDAITYKDFVVGQKYKVVGQIVDKEAPDKVLATVESEFEVKETSGTVTQVFTVDTSDKDGHTLVCFETVYDKDGNIIAQHKDIEDKDQSVTVKTTTTVQTGIQNNSTTLMMIALIIMFIAVMGTVGVFGIRRFRQVDNSDDE